MMALVNRRGEAKTTSCDLPPPTGKWMEGGRKDKVREVEADLGIHVGEERK